MEVTSSAKLALHLETFYIAINIYLQSISYLKSRGGPQIPKTIARSILALIKEHDIEFFFQRKELF